MGVPKVRKVYRHLRFLVVGTPDLKTHTLYFDDVDKIQSDFKEHAEAYARFRNYCENYNDEDGAKYTMGDFNFASDLQRSIDKRLQYGQAFFSDVLEELMRREGVDVNWGKNWSKPSDDR
ncbi:MAG: hypothetical protein HKN28_04890 [Alphaproteobacteria bacterium]|nr:hypothetical protein [Alphaproteobacteria bacterium]